MQTGFRIYFFVFMFSRDICAGMELVGVDWFDCFFKEPRGFGQIQFSSLFPNGSLQNRLELAGSDNTGPLSNTLLSVN